MRKLLVCAASALALATTALPAQASSGATNEAATRVATAAAIDWGVCASTGLQQRGAECATIDVPLDYDKPRGTKIGIAISRIKHKVPDSEYQGVMLVNPGGPGGSGLTLSVLGEYVPKDAGLAYDWIGFDPRGVGSSDPVVSCDKEYAGFNRPKYVPTSHAIEKVWRRKARGYAKDCAVRNGTILDHLKTTDSAKDMNSIRKALGAEQINYYGFSYGTYLGQVFATLFPGKLRRTVFDGTVDPTDVWYDANLNQDVAFDRNMNIWFDWLAEHNDVYKLGDTGEKISKLFYATQKKLYKTPAEGSQGKLGGSEWTDSFLYAGYYESTWIDLGQTFSDYINNNDIEALQSAYLDVSGFGEDNGYAVYLGVQCTDVQWPTKWSKWQRDNWKIHAKAPFETWPNAWYNAPCFNWPAKADKKAVKVNGKHTKSLLMINETLDAATPYPGSLQVRKMFPKASLIAVPGGTTHSNSLNGNACVDDQIADYLIDGTLPKRKHGNRADTTCEMMPKPDPSAQLRQKSAAKGDITRLDLQKISAGR